MATLAELFSTAYHSAKENALRQRAQEAQENYWQRLLEQQAEELALRKYLGDQQFARDDRNFEYQAGRDAVLDKRWEREFQAALDQWQQDHGLRKEGVDIQRQMAGTQADYLRLARDKHEAEMDLINQQKRIAELIGEIEFRGTQSTPVTPPTTMTSSDWLNMLTSGWKAIMNKHDWDLSQSPAVIQRRNREANTQYIEDMLSSVDPVIPQSAEELMAGRSTQAVAAAKQALLYTYDYLNNPDNPFDPRERRRLMAAANLKAKRLGFDLHNTYTMMTSQQPNATNEP